MNIRDDLHLDNRDLERLQSGLENFFEISKLSAAEFQSQRTVADLVAFFYSKSHPNLPEPAPKLDAPAPQQELF